ncbi:MAG: glycosyltransferase [Candidatus Peribacteraceae bacterium]|nr:glycosyltransferase [Candidatus Peribacteraceae bacterium]
MKIVLATGIYPPDIGGPATYVRALAAELHQSGHEVTVITYGKADTKKTTISQDGAWEIISVPWKGKPVIRWFLFARALKKFAADADIIEAFSSVSVGVPLMLARLRKPRKVLRLGGDFIWERYTARGGMLGLRAWYESGPFLWKMQRLLLVFHHIIFSTRFQEEIYEKHFRKLPGHSVIENTLPSPSPAPLPRALRSSRGRGWGGGFRLLVLSRLVRFKNYPSLIAALSELPDVTLTIVGGGPEEGRLRAQVAALNLQDRVRFLPSVAGEEKQRIFADHDLLVIPSITEISPNAALEARAAGLPVLLTKETGLSPELSAGMIVREILTPAQIASAVKEIMGEYDRFAATAAEPMIERGWGTVAGEHVGLFDDLLCRGAAAPLFGAKKLLMISGDRSVLAGKRSAFAQMLEEFSKHWERIDIICPRQQLTVNNSPFTQLPEKVHFHPSSRGLWYQPFWIKKKGSELIAAQHHDVMTVHDYPPFYNGIGARMLRKICTIPAVIELHHVVGWPKPASITEWIGKWMSRIFLPSHVRHFDAVRIVSRPVGDLLRSWDIASDRLKLVPSFYLNTDVFRPDPSAEKKYDLVCCARLVANKGFGKLLRALKELPETTLLLIGDGPLRSSLESRAVSLGIANRVTSAGWLPTERDIAAGIRSARLFVMPSKSEGGPRVALEAMACGIPVLTTRVGIMPDVIEEGVNGAFTNGTEEDLRERSEALLSDAAALDAMGKKAVGIGGKFEKGKTIREYAEFLQKVRYVR